MCGIAGIVQKNSRGAVESMVKAMHHRGPDDSGIYSDEYMAMGMARLSIIDLSPLGHQPMQSHNGRYWIVFNGECYNFQDLRAKLEKEGVRFRSHSDTEVVLEAYSLWGERCLQEMNGMFSFAIWDTMEKKLFVARDHLGIKPFFYALHKQAFIFGSEIKTLVASGQVSKALDRNSVARYFTFGHVHQPDTILEEVKALMPGHYLTWHNGKLQISEYWSLKPQPANWTYAEAREQLWEQLKYSVKQQLVSDRPLGLFLSGGLDSASVLASMKAGGQSIKTFSIGFGENPYAKNEAKEATELAQHFGADHHQITVDAGVVSRELESYWKALDQPSVDGLNTYLVSKYAREHMTVALSGLGGDELFAGYARHARILWKLANQNAGTQLLNALTPSGLLKSTGALGEWSYKVKQNVDRGSIARNYAYTRATEIIPRSLRALNPAFVNSIDWDTIFYGTFGKDTPNSTTPLNEILQLDLQSFMGAMLLRDMDAVSMWHSLEVRFPLIDYKLVELAFSLPDDYKLAFDRSKKPPGEGKLSYRQAGNKKILMDTLEPHLPVGFAERPKNGFKLPIAEWLKGADKKRLREIIFDLPEGWNQFIQEGQMQSLYEAFSERNEQINRFWKVASFAGVISKWN